MKNHLRWLLAVLAIAWVGLCLNHAFGDFTTDVARHEALLAALAVILILGSLTACIFRKTRLVAIVLMPILVVTGAATRSVRSHRLASGIQQLEVIYGDIAARGQPFPDAIDGNSYEKPAFLHWYYQKHSEQSFAIVYIVSSNGWAMEFPGGAWRFIGYWPDGYSPNVATDATR